jgi:hypothetical protein
MKAEHDQSKEPDLRKCSICSVVSSHEKKIVERRQWNRKSRKKCKIRLVVTPFVEEKKAAGARLHIVAVESSTSTRIPFTTERQE